MLPLSSRSRSRTSSASVTLRSRKSFAPSLSAARYVQRARLGLRRIEGGRELMQRLVVRTQVENLPHRAAADALLAAQGRQEAGVDDRRLAAARAADDRDDIRRRALADLLDKLVDEPLPAEEQARVLLAERQQAAIGREAGEQLFGRRVVDRLALRAGDEALQPLGVVEARAQIDIGVELEKPPDRHGVVGEARQEHGNDRKDLRRFFGRNLAARARPGFRAAATPRGRLARRAREGRGRPRDAVPARAARAARREGNSGRGMRSVRRLSGARASVSAAAESARE